MAIFIWRQRLRKKFRIKTALYFIILLLIYFGLWRSTQFEFEYKIFKKLSSKLTFLDTKKADMDEPNYDNFDDSDANISNWESKGPLVLKSVFQNQLLNQTGISQAKHKLILLWSSCYGAYSLAGWFAHDDTFEDCPYKCDLTIDRKFYKQSDALFFEGLPGSSYYRFPEIHDISEQIWAFFRIEAPLNGEPAIMKYNNIFNWTITYRLDSDVTWSAARFAPIEGAGSTPSHKIPTLESLKDKKLIVWIVSNCHTRNKREIYTKMLKEHVNIDIYGACGTFKCPKKVNCYEKISQQYKFYLAFENSICTDYVTEKMYFAMKNGMVPIVYGDPSFTNVAIPGSYINVYDFDSVKNLTDYLKRLDEHPEDYLKYFEWMKKFIILDNDECVRQNWCNICTKLHKTDMNTDRKVYPSIHQWLNYNYTEENVCKQPNFDDKGNFKSQLK